MNIFEFDSYKAFVIKRIEAMPGRGRGQFRELAHQLRMHTTLMSQIFRGDRHLSMEQACDLCLYWGLGDLETEMFLALLQREKAGSYALKKVLSKQIASLQAREEKLEHRLPTARKLSEEARSVFYSNWYFSGVRILTSIPEFRTVDAIAEKLSLPRKVVAGVLEFLVAHDLCVKEKGGFRMGPQRTHLSPDSALIARHHLNWRVKTIGRAESLGAQELMFTAPLSISEKDARKVRKKIVEFISAISDLVNESKPEKLVCFNLDWIDV